MNLVLALAALCIGAGCYKLGPKLQLLRARDGYVNKVVNFRPSPSNSGRGPVTRFDETVFGLALPNTALVQNRFDSEWPVLSIDFGSSNFGLSFNHMNKFKLFESIRFKTYWQVTAELLELIRGLREEHGIDRLAVLLGFPFSLTSSPRGAISHLPTSNESGGSTDLKLLFQILYTLDFSCYLAYQIDKTFNPPPRDDGSEVATTHCLHCSILGSSSKGIECKIHSNGCSNAVNLGGLNFCVLGASEQHTTYQVNALGSSSLDRPGVGKRVVNKDNLSSLNIYYNLVNSQPGGGDRFLVLPNGNNIFDNDSKSNNILLYRYLKSALMRG